MPRLFNSRYLFKSISLLMANMVLFGNFSFAAESNFSQDKECLAPEINISDITIRQGVNEFIKETRLPASALSQEMKMKLADAKAQLDELQARADSINIQSADRMIDELRALNLKINYLKPDADNKELFNNILRQRSDLAKNISGVLTSDQELYTRNIEKLVAQTKEDMARHIEQMVAAGKFTSEKAKATLNKAIQFIEEWLDPENKLPAYIKQGIYKGMLEGRFGDLLYAFGFGWRQFGTAGIRNQAVQSEFEAILQKELDEFSQDAHAPILTGPNLMNVVTLLQQVSALVLVVNNGREKLEAKIAENKTLEQAAQELGIEPEFAQNLRDNTITITYDSRLNGAYFAHLLAAAFLREGIRIHLFDSPSGVPAGVSIAKGASFFGEMVKDERFAGFARIKGSSFGILISASHSEAEYNGFKAFLGYQKSQVDAATKNMIMEARTQVGYGDLDLDLDTGVLDDLNPILQENKNNLIWLGGAERSKNRDYCGAEFVPFYPLYFEYLKKRSPIPYDQLDKATIDKINAAKIKLPILYTAFYGGGAIPAANFPAFFEQMGYKDVQIVERQTAVMDGKFPGHIMPDPGVTEGWMSNLYHFLMQAGKEDLSDIAKAVVLLNSREVGAATDPDVDRAGIMLGMEEGQQGNIRSDFSDWMRKTLEARTDLTGTEKENIVQALSLMKDKLLNTANDAWTFMTFYKLQIREQFGLLKKNKLYFIEKSHVTADGLEEVAKYYRDKGYYVYVVDTYVGFTELAKKSRDLFTIAKTAWQIRDLIAQGGDIQSALREMKKQNEVLKENVPYGTAGVEIIDRAINLLEQGDLPQAAGILDIVAHMENLVAVEESNGYGELGEYVPETDTVINAHISEKDGGLALFEFFENLSYGKAVLGKSGYEMFLDMLGQTGYCATDNQFLKYPGLTGVQEKEDAIEGLEKIFAVLVQKKIDAKESVTLFNGKYTVESVQIYRDKKYDVSYNGFPEEGIRLVLRTRLGSKAITTFRPSGTGDSNRDYNWIIGLVPEAGTDMEQYRREKIAELEELRKDFFGVFGQVKGYAELSKENFYGLLIAVKEAGVSGQIEIFNKVFDVPAEFTPTESSLLSEVKKYTYATRNRKQEYGRMKPDQVKEELQKTIAFAQQNYQTWNKYLSAKEAKTANAKFLIKANGVVLAEVPNHIVKPWMNSLAGYVAEAMILSGQAKAEIETADPEVTNEIRFQLQTRLSWISALNKSQVKDVLSAEETSERLKNENPAYQESVKALERSI